jgi:hypothetical protein
MIQFSKKHKLIVALYFVLLFCFIVVRSITVPLLPDEAFTYFLYVEPATFFAPAAQMDANNHLLNSILSFCSADLFGHSTFTLRLPNLLFALLYFFSSYRIAKYQSTKLSFWITLIALNSVYPVIEFLSLSRGYGMSYALLLTGVLVVFEFQRTKHRFLPWLLLIVVVLGLSAQLSMLFAFGGMLMLVIGILFTEKKVVKSWLNWLYVGISCFVILLFVKHIYELKSAGLLYFGTTDNFPFSSLKSLNSFLYDSFSIVSTMFLFILMLASIVYLIIRIYHFTWSNLSSNSIVFPFVLFCSIAGTIISISFFEGNGPLSRTALYFFVLLIGSLYFIDITPRIKMVFGLISLVLSVYSMRLINLNYVNYWSNHAVKSEIYSILLEDDNQNKSVGGSIYLDRIFCAEHTIFNKGKSTNFYLLNDNFVATDYLLLTKSDVSKYQNQLEDYNLLISDSLGVSLFKLEHQKELQIIDSVVFNYSTDTNEYIGLGTYFADSTLQLKPFVLDVEMQSNFPTRNSDVNWVVSLFDKENQHIDTRYYRLSHFSREWNTGKLFKFSLTIPEMPDNTFEMRMYLYNPKKQFHKTIDVNYKLLVYE